MRKFAAATLVGLAALSLSSCASVPSLDKAVAGHGSLADPSTPVGINARRQPDDLQTVALREIKGSPSFHLKGTVAWNGTIIAIDATFGRSSSAGRIKYGSGAVARYRYVDDTTFITGSPGFWKFAMRSTAVHGAGMKAVLKFVHGKWIRFKRGTGATAAAFRRSDILTRLHYVPGVTRGPVQTLHGVRVVSFRVPGPAQSTVFVRADGRPYLARIQSGGSVLDFDGWNKPFAAHKPPAKDTVRFPGS